MSEQLRPSTKKRLLKERLSVLHQLEDWLELPMVFLGVIWLLLLVLDFTTSWGVHLETAATVIWVLFILDFLLKLIVAPDRWRYMRRNWLTLLALAIPALRVFRAFRAIRVFRAVRASRGIRLVRVFTSLNRGMKSLGSVLGRRGFGYVMGLTLLVILAGSAGMFAFEREHDLRDYGTALWWTAMIVTTMGSESWPKSPEGRILCLFLAIYAFAVFGYVTASLASFFVEKDARNPDTEIPSREQIEALRADLAQIRMELSRWNSQKPRVQLPD